MIMFLLVFFYSETNFVKLIKQIVDSIIEFTQGSLEKTLFHLIVLGLKIFIETKTIFFHRFKLICIDFSLLT